MEVADGLGGRHERGGFPADELGVNFVRRLVQMHPPRRLGRGMKLALRASRGDLTDLSFMKSRSSVLRADSRLIVLLMVTRMVCPGFTSIAIMVLRSKRGEV